MTSGLIITSIVLIISIYLIIVLRKKNIGLSADLSRFDGFVSIEKEVESKKSELEQLKKETQNLNDKYIKAKEIFKELENDIEIYKNDLEFIDFGLYLPIFNFEDTEQYKEELTNVKEEQKSQIKNGDACVTNINWTVNNSLKKGEMMTRRNINLSLRAFNSECDALISKVRWNNVKQFEKRIKKAFEAVNKLGKSTDTYITESYYQLKLDELHLVYEYALKKQEEREHQRQIRQEQREEERAQREFDIAKKEAELEEKRYQKAIRKARKELGLVSGEELNKLNEQIQQLQQNLEEAQAAKERAISRAQLTKSGHVYIISNIGSFGENVIKIGMTRRLDPMDRVKELGDASVPFRFDLHAMIFSKNAPELESLLHKKFNNKRINKVNFRKEYFNITLEEIEEVINDYYNEEFDFIRVTEAKEYRETESIIKQQLDAQKIAITEREKYPDTLF